MNLAWAKDLMPRGIYGRAALILFMPVITVTLVVTVLFLQRHFESVTRQMTVSMAQEVGFVAARIEAAPDLAAAQAVGQQIAAPLGLELTLPAPIADTDLRSWDDLSGRIVTEVLHQVGPRVRAVDLSQNRLVQLSLDGRWGAYRLDFSRSRVSARNPHQLLVLMIGTSALMSGIATIFLRNQMRPIRRLARAADAYGRGQVLPYKPSGATEVRSAGTAFLNMRNRIERLNEQRRLMLSGVSHDLRTPLTRLRLGLSMLSTDLPPERDEITAMERDVAQMGQMVDAFLDMVRTDVQDSPPEPVAALDFIRQVVSDAQRGGQNVTLDVSAGDPVGIATFRPAAVRRVVENLIGNATRYGTRASVGVALSDRSLKVSVEDDGPGIPEDRRDEALRPFTRLDPARNQDRGQGVGLGLAIAADMARSHGGSLRLMDGERLGGLRVELVIPR
ncbi:MAG: ATP-binding protein [Paracoccus sp. (in: a-proteobacteria)]|uniref:ATP-binding protein n=1 Tax=Paracoccus sp. TaxID=267 RepID=UPI0026DEB3B6|nr:ATP-binding protein [Paracoccus sp. (in: a-proteobacteria)]MDO5622580.1 ATP-binding protein [Paracoccus sp. (in: a-proteobacteria)]